MSVTLQQAEQFFDYIAQREDARDAGDDAEFNYWRGYLDACLDEEGFTDDLAEIEAHYAAAMKWAGEMLDAATAFGKEAAAKREP